MFLRKLEIKNYRSLEVIELKGLSNLNVLIGRNNAGKSAILGALEVLNRAIHGQQFDWPTVLTAKDSARALEMRMLLELSNDDRRSFIGCLEAPNSSANRVEAMHASPLARRAEYLFR